MRIIESHYLCSAESEDPIDTHLCIPTDGMRQRARESYALNNPNDLSFEAIRYILNNGCVTLTGGYLVIGTEGEKTQQDSRVQRRSTGKRGAAAVQKGSNYQSGVWWAGKTR